jgi:hypothetical protein
MRPLAWLVALLVGHIAHAELIRPALTQAPLLPKLRLDLDSVFERAMGAAHVGLTDGKVKFLRVRRGQREDVSALLGRAVRVMPVVDLSFTAASLMTRFVF